MFWFALLVIVVALLVSLRPGASEIQIRVAGLFLQWFGIGTVAHGIHQTRKLFGRPSITTSLHEWLSRFPRWRRNVVFGAGTATAGALGVSARGHVWSNVDPTAAVETQLDAVIKNVDRLKEWLLQLQTEMDAEFRKHFQALHQEEQVRARDDTELQARLEAAETGGLHITLIGVVFLVVGVLLSTISPEIARWVS